MDLTSACDVRCGLNNNNIKIGITEIGVGVPYPSLMYLLIKTRIPLFKHKILISQPNKLFTPNEAYKYGYFTDIVDTKDKLMELCMNEANRVHPDSINAYLSVKNYLWQNEIYKIWINEKDGVMDEFARVWNTEYSKRSLQAMADKVIKKKKKSKL